MAKLSVDQWDATAGNNTDVGGISIAEGCAMANLNNGMREIMAQVKTYNPPSPTILTTLQGKGADVASAGITSLGDGSYFHITGTTTITDIDFATPQNGREAVLIFDGILTLTHNATTLILPGGVSITTAAGDRCTVVQDSSDNVYVTNYTKADGTAVVAAAASMTLLGTLTTTSGTTQSLTSIAAGYRQLYCEVVGVSFSTAVALTLTTSSTNGAAYGTAASITGALANNGFEFGGVIEIYNVGSAVANAKTAWSSIRETNSGSDRSVAAAAVPSNTAAVVDAIQFAGGTFDAGTIRIYGVK